MSGDHNQYQKDKSYLDGMDRYKQVRELVKDPSLKIKDIVELTGYDKGHVSRLRKASQQFECTRCGHCCQADQLTQQQEPVAWTPQVWRQFRPDGTLEFQKIKRTPNGEWEDYTAPPKRDLTCVCGAVWEDETMVHPPRKREWVGLTDEEKIELWNKHENHWRFEDNLMAFTRAIEAKLKEKNT